MKRATLVLGGAAAIGAVIAVGLPEFKHYLKIRSM